MTSRLVMAPPLAHQARRQLAAQASAKAKKLPQAGANLPEAKMSTLENGVTVISVETPNTPLSTIGVVVRSGPRFETYENQGVSHALRICAGTGTRRFSAFNVVRSMEHAGGPLKCVQGREHLLYASQLHRDKLDDAVDFLLDCAGAQAFKPWEVKDNVGRMKLELEQVEPAVRVNEMLHRAAYRAGMGYSLYSPEHMIGCHKPAMMQSFYNKTFSGNRVAVVGLGMDHARLSSYAGQLTLEAGEGPKGEAKYYGGEQRKDAPGRKAFIALAAEMAGGTNIKEAIAAMILQRIWGTQSSLKWGSGVGKLQKAVSESSGSGSSSVTGPPKAQAFTFVYSDTGLLGTQIVADVDIAGKAVSAAAATMRNASSVTADEVSAAKRGLMTDAYGILLENSLSRCEDLGLQALLRKEIIPVGRAPEIVESVQVGDVQAVAKKVSGSKLSMAAYGNLASVPYVDAL